MHGVLTEEALLPGTVKRRDIQGLRAVAVTSVAVYHFFPAALPGGFVGVDVFFVISGYLITLLLLRELAERATISLPRFYTRRVRRLMPAALATTLTTVAVAAFTVDPVRLVDILHDAAWTNGYLANVHFARASTGYFATPTPSPLLHFWSLAVEEQYYLLWPLLLLATASVARKRFATVLPVVLATVVATSLYASSTLTKAGSTSAYFSLWARAWELAVGGAVAVLTVRQVRPRGPLGREVASAVGMAAMAYAAIRFSRTTAFPGTAALVPTLGTALVIWTGTDHVGVLGRLLGKRPVQLVGDASYSLYLWHWPVLVLGESLVGRTLTDRATLALVAVVLGFESHRLIERPSGGIARPWAPKRVLGFGLAITLAAVALPLQAARAVQVTGGRVEDATPAIAARATIRDRTVQVTLDRRMTPPLAVPSNVDPQLDALKDDLAEVFTNGCYTAVLRICEGGDPAGRIRVVLAGDSHVGQWWPAVDAAARRRGWKLYIVGKNGCALADVPVSLETTDKNWPACNQWQQDAMDAVVRLQADVVLYANHAQGYSEKLSLRDDFERQWTRGVSTTLERFTKVSTVVVFGQSPILGQDPATCLAAHLDDITACAPPLDTAVLPSVRRLVSSLAARSGAYYFDPASLLCSTTCPLIDGNTIVYHDIGHIDRTYSRSLTDALDAVVSAVLDATFRPGRAAGKPSG